MILRERRTYRIQGRCAIVLRKLLRFPPFSHSINRWPLTHISLSCSFSILFTILFELQTETDRCMKKTQSKLQGEREGDNKSEGKSCHISWWTTVNDVFKSLFAICFYSSFSFTYFPWFISSVCWVLAVQIIKTYCYIQFGSSSTYPPPPETKKKMMKIHRRVFFCLLRAFNFSSIEKCGKIDFSRDEKLMNMPLSCSILFIFMESISLLYSRSFATTKPAFLFICSVCTLYIPNNER